MAPPTNAASSPEFSRKHRKLELPSPEPEVCNPGPESFAHSYQLEALEMTKRQKTIAFHETGTGKTLIAVMLIRSYSYIIPKLSEIIEICCLIKQAEVIETHTDLKVEKFWGEKLLGLAFEAVLLMLGFKRVGVILCIDRLAKNHVTLDCLKRVVHIQVEGTPTL